MATSALFRRPLALIGLLGLVLMTALIANGRVTVGNGLAAAAEGPCGTGTAFFGSAPVDTQFAEGDTWQGATFTNIESDPNVMNARIVVTGDQVGRFPSTSGGATATIVFAEPVMITGILWYGNDPEGSEVGWTLNGMAGPITAGTEAECQTVSFVADTITITTDDSGGIDFWFEPVPSGGEGCTPGYWKNHLDAWIGFTPSQTLESVFDVPNSLGYDNTTLLAALKFDGGSGVQGGARILLRAAVASLLNSTSVDFSMTTAEVIAEVNAALASGSRSTMLALAGELDAENNSGCPLN
jgi:hypothetical protein